MNAISRYPWSRISSSSTRFVLVLAVFVVLGPMATADTAPMRHPVDRQAGRPVERIQKPEGPGLLERNKLRYYRPPVDPRLRQEHQLPPIDLVAFRRPWGDEARFRLEKVAFLDGWQGGPLDGAGAATRYEVAFMLGKLCETINMRFGEVFDVSLTGPRHVVLPRLGWGDRYVRLAVRAGMMRVEGGADWWLRPLSRGRYIRLLDDIVVRLRRLTPVVELPLRFPPRGAGSGVPLPPDPRFAVLRDVFRRGLYDISDAGWDIRGYVLRRDVAQTMDRLMFVAWGYREPERPESPVGERPKPE